MGTSVSPASHHVVGIRNGPLVNSPSRQPPQLPLPSPLPPRPPRPLERPGEPHGDSATAAVSISASRHGRGMPRVREVK